jgi:Protein of unknown function (DUF3606).
MHSNSQDKHPRDLHKVNVHETRELNYWTQKFGVSVGQLRVAVNKVGTLAKDVEKYLGR